MKKKFDLSNTFYQEMIPEREKNSAYGFEENFIQPHQCIMPLFVGESSNHFEKAYPLLKSMKTLSTSEAYQKVLLCIQKGIKKILLFPVVNPQKKKDPFSSKIFNQKAILSLISIIKKNRLPIEIIVDVCLCAFTKDGHCGLLNSHGKIDNKSSLELLSELATIYAQAGADQVAPSAMMDGQMIALRKNLDINHFSNCRVLPYSVKYCSSLYTPFRLASQCSLAEGENRTAYQMDIKNKDHIYREALSDIQQGAESFIIKPASWSMDVIYRLHQYFPNISLYAYHVSGSYMMIKKVSEKYPDLEKKLVLELFNSFVRSGVKYIISYYAIDYCSFIETKSS